MKTKTFTEKRFFKWVEDDVSVSIRARSGSYGGGSEVLIIESNQNHAQIKDSETCFTLTGSMGMGGGYVPMITEERAVCIGNGQLDQLYESDKAGALNCMHDQQAVRQRYLIRRLTPKECERLQGYPDGWTDIGEWTDTKGKKRQTSDSARYKALGNSIALPYWKVLCRRIAAQYDRTPTMASLFDGIGGFPFCWELCCGKGTAVWASEIEEFCIAVTKRRFGDE